MDKYTFQIKILRILFIILSFVLHCHREEKSKEFLYVESFPDVSLEDIPLDEQGKIIAWIPYGEKVEVLEKKTELSKYRNIYYKVKYKGVEGWVWNSDRLVKEKPPYYERRKLIDPEVFQFPINRKEIEKAAMDILRERYAKDHAGSEDGFERENMRYYLDYPTLASVYVTDCSLKRIPIIIVGYPDVISEGSVTLFLHKVQNKYILHRFVYGGNEIDFGVKDAIKGNYDFLGHKCCECMD
jgi:hypothetical protein